MIAAAAAVAAAAAAAANQLVAAGATAVATDVALAGEAASHVSASLVLVVVIVVGNVSARAVPLHLQHMRRTCMAAPLVDCHTVTAAAQAPGPGAVRLLQLLAGYRLCQQQAGLGAMLPQHG